MGSADVAAGFPVEISQLRIDSSPMEAHVAESVAIAQLHTIALESTTSPTHALLLLLFAVCDLCEMSSSTDDALTAAIALLQQWRDGGPPVPSAEQLWAELPEVPVAPAALDHFDIDEPTGDMS